MHEFMKPKLWKNVIMLAMMFMLISSFSEWLSSGDYGSIPVPVCLWWAPWCIPLPAMWPLSIAAAIHQHRNNNIKLTVFWVPVRFILGEKGNCRTSFTDHRASNFEFWHQDLVQEWVFKCLLWVMFCFNSAWNDPTCPSFYWTLSLPFPFLYI